MTSIVRSAANTVLVNTTDAPTVVLSVDDVPTVVVSSVGVQGPPGTPTPAYVTRITYNSATHFYQIAHNLHSSHLSVSAYVNNQQVRVGAPIIVSADVLTLPIIGASDGTMFDVVVTG